MLKYYPYPGLYGLLLLALTLSFSCKCYKRHFNTADSLSVKDSVSKMATNIATDISAKGPIAWLKYFQDSPNFFMANDGVLMFHNHQSAEVFIQDTLVKVISKISLRWGNLRIDPLTPRIAAVGADYHEDITFANGKTIPADGYFSGIAILTPNGWKVRNCHWSAKK